MAYPDNEDQVAADALRGIVAEIERCDDRITSENKQKSEIFKKAKDDGFNVKALRKVIAARRMDDADRLKLDDDFDLYMMHVEGLAHAHVENIEQIGSDDDPDHDPETGEIIEPAIAADPAEGAEPPSPQQASSAEPIHESSSNNDEASSTAAPQGEAVHSQGTGAETLAGREERSEGQAASADLPTQSLSESNEGKPVGLSPSAGGETDGVASRLSVGSGTDASNSVDANAGGEDADAVSNAGGQGAASPAPTAASNALKLRPWCQHADDLSKCAGQGRKHCYACQKAHADANGEPA